ncbi:FKBP-type peptidyl-prolyl cis-trans isomerase [Herbaspirillum sp. alder98]|uniref:FKBP-type peptidyl-prolyl cis-trans isomerase n=1 Tax=Herbaspirillum sp. alder98 TaxID=2913096 RepID=UPI001CD88A3F|nr:peptidylprolyl isomerase [Herbaspirillum sp. alder98]MCA1323090.1 peptidylprolyl isomerase [Herbaspirillum sp. alder98]
MKIEKNTVVSVKYKLSDAQGNLIEESSEPMVYLHGGYQNTLPKIEETLDGKDNGFSTIIQVEPEDAFGEYDAALVKIEPLSRLPQPIEVGMQFEGSPDDDDEESVIFTVTEVADDKAVLDGNHPLAGIALRFDLSVIDVRAASDEEIAHGHVHGAHGHHHHHEEDDGEQGDHFRSQPLN